MKEYGEDKFVIMFGGLHIEMAGLTSLGTLLEGSGWTSAITEAGVASSGTAESFLTASSVTRTKQAHQITACSLHPGFIMTEVFRRLPGPIVWWMNLLFKHTLCKSVEEGAETILTCLAQRNLVGGGYHVDNRPNPRAQIWGDEGEMSQQKRGRLEEEVRGVIDEFTLSSIPDLKLHRF